MRPVTVQLVVAVVQVRPPGEDVTVYEVIAEPPVVGAVHDTVTCVLPNTPDTPVGASGTVEGTTAEDALDAEPVPAALVAVTVNV